MRPRIALVATLLVAAGCGEGTGPGTNAALRLLQQRQRWEEREPPAYSFEYHEICFCAAGDGGVQVAFRVEVIQGVVASVTPVPGSVLAGATTSPLPGELSVFYATIESVFERVAAAMRSGADVVEVEYDAEYGFPRQVSADVDRRAPDDGFRIEVRDFRILGILFLADQ
jgi:hypothetical protein